MTETERAGREAERADRSLFMQELLLALMSESTDCDQPSFLNGLDCWSSVDDLPLSDSECLLSKSANSLAASSRPSSSGSLAVVCDDRDSASMASSQVVQNCEPVGKESFSMNVGSYGASSSHEVARTKAGVL